MNTCHYTADCLVPFSSNAQAVHYGLQGSIVQRIVSDETTRLLWHSRLGHLNFRCLYALHKSVEGLPVIKDAHQVDHCPSCLESKLCQSPTGQGSMIDKASSPGQIMAADWGFICYSSEDQQHMLRLRSVFGETSYLIFTCAFSGALFGVCSPSKAVPLEWLDMFFF